MVASPLGVTAVAVALSQNFDIPPENLVTEGYGERSKLSARAEFFEEHGRYDKALEIFDKLYSAGRKRGWHYTWLLYKNAKFEPAYENFSRLAERSYGSRRR